jgi:hypothetical protein
MPKVVTLGFGPAQQLVPSLGLGGGQSEIASFIIQTDSGLTAAGASTPSPSSAGPLNGGNDYIIATATAVNTTVYNDSFDEDALSNDVWTVTAVGQATYVSGSGLKATIGPAASSSLTLKSTLVANNGDAQFTYQLSGNAITNPPTGNVDFATLALTLGSDSVVISRAYDIVLGNILAVSATIGGVVFPAGSISTTALGGTLRIVYFGTGVYAFHTDQFGNIVLLFRVPLALNAVSATGVFSISSSNGGSSIPFVTSYESFTVSNVVTFGGIPDFQATFPTANRILGVVPAGTAFGSVNVTINMTTGVSLTLIDGYTYVVVPTAFILTTNQGRVLLSSTDPAVHS